MQTYIALASFTDQGLRNVKDTVRRAESVKDLAGRFGVKMTDIHWTLGPFDLVVVCEAQDDASITAFSLATGAAGNVRLQTLRAFTRDEMSAVLGKLPQT